MLDLYDVYDDYLIDNKDTWPHQYIRFDDTSYTNEYDKDSDAKHLKEIRSTKKSINSYAGSKDKFFIIKNYIKITINQLMKLLLNISEKSSY